MGFLRSLITQRRARFLVTSLGIAVFAGALAFFFSTQTTIGQELEGRSVDYRFEQRGVQKPSDDIVIIDISEKTDDVLKMSFPYPRDTYAVVVDNLVAAGVSTIVFDIQFFSNRGSSQENIDFLDALHTTTFDVPVVIATTKKGFVDDGTPRIPTPFEEVLTGDAAIDEDAFKYSGATTGITDIKTTSGDDVKRLVKNRTTASTIYGRRVIPSLSLATLAAANNASIDQFRDIPVDMLINYTGPARSYTYLPFEDVALGAIDASLASQGAAAGLDGKIAIIGASSPVLQDIHEIPFGNMPGVEIHANAIDTMRNEDWLREPSPWLTLMISLAFMIVIWGLLVVIRPIVGVIASLAMIGLYILQAQRAFADGTVLPMFPPLHTATVVFATVVTALAVNAVRDRRRVRNLFARYVSPEVVRKLVETEDVIELGGERREITVLFSDIRGFTTLSEHIDPTEMVEQLNEYFGEMVEIIEDEMGMLDKFIGDGLMAIFGAPLEQPDHAKRACHAAHKMVAKLKELNDDRETRGLARLEMGVGIHTGIAVVGNVGSPKRRVDFTAIGDTVNLSSRLEGATKKLGVPVLVSQTTAAQAVPDHDFRQYGSIVVKGRTQATEVFELVIEDVVDGYHLSSVDEGLSFSANDESEPMDGFLDDLTA